MKYSDEKRKAKTNFVYDTRKQAKDFGTTFIILLFGRTSGIFYPYFPHSGSDTECRGIARARSKVALTTVIRVRKGCGPWFWSEGKRRKGRAEHIKSFSYRRRMMTMKT